MQKEMYILRGAEQEEYAEFRRRVFRIAHDFSQETTVEKLKVCLTTHEPPRVHIIPFQRKKIATLSVWLREEEEPFVHIRTGDAGVSGGYRVEEALPVAYEKYWRDNERTPGAGLLTLFRKRPELDYPTFLRRWHESHTPISLRIHPLWNYNRNVVRSTVPDWENGEWFDAIVEEQVRETSHLLNPSIFFGSPVTMLWNMGLIFFDSRSFIDYKSMEIFLVDEYHIEDGSS